MAYMSILRRFPHDTTVLAELRPVLVELSELQLCQKLYADAFEHYQQLAPTGSTRTEDGRLLSGAGFDEFHVYVLADLYNTLGDYEKAIHTIRAGVRWLQGRGGQKMWDMVSDDREYDVEGTKRPASDDDTEAVQPGHFDLDVNARHRIAIARLKLGEIDEAKVILVTSTPQNLIDHLQGPHENHFGMRHAGICSIVSRDSRRLFRERVI
jgi:general transcription factor 3C polypeptide 3 (transcription factor C subunit 4)